MPVHRLSLILTGCLLLCGCGKPTEIPGGTPGIIHVDGTPLADVQVTVWRTIGESEVAETPAAFGISSADGRFELRRPESLEAVWLEPGDYRFTIESVGGIYLAWPADYGTPEKTPLRQDWSEDDQEIELKIPEPRAEP